MTAVDLAEMNEVSLSEQEVDPGFTRVSRMAIASLCLAVLSILILVSGVFIPVSLFAIALSVVALVRIGRDPSLGGAAFAQFGLGLATLFFCWSTVATIGRHNHLYKIAGQHAETYLAAIASGDTYTACELQRSEPSRQLTGTNLAAIYENELLDEAEAHELLLKMASTKLVLDSGPDADWRFAKGLRIEDQHPFTLVTVALENEANLGDGQVVIKLRREIERFPKPGTLQAAIWSVDASRLPSETTF